jgi:hypothetical protein
LSDHVHQDSTPDHEEEGHPLGTLFVLMVFLAALVGMWSVIYVMFLER